MRTHPLLSHDGPDASGEASSGSSGGTTRPMEDEPRDRHFAEQSDPHQPPPTSDAQSRRIAQRSPEGIPADPGMDRHALNRMVVGFAIVALIVAVVLSAFVNRWAGVAVAALAVGALLFNPALWAAVLRVREREG